MFETLIEVGSQEANDTITNITQSKINPFVIFIQKPNELWKLILYISVSTLCGIFVLATLIYTLKRVSLLHLCEHKKKKYFTF